MVEVGNAAARRTNSMSPFLPPNPFWRSGARPKRGYFFFFLEEGPCAFFAAADQAKRKGKAYPRRTATH